MKHHTPEHTKAPALSAASRLNQNYLTSVPPREEVARRAYHKYESSGYSSGNELQHWLEAEAELTAKGQEARAA